MTYSPTRHPDLRMAATAFAPPAARTLVSLSILRAIAALIVVAYHCIYAWPHSGLGKDTLGFGYLGVSFFFCLSGFINQWSWLTKPTDSAYDFYARRIAKIFPLAITTLTISVASYYSLGYALAGYSNGKASIIYSAFLVQAWASWVPEIRQSWNGVSWSLSCEIFFYALSPLILPIFARLSFRRAAFTASLLFVTYAGGNILLQGVFWSDFFTFSPAGRLSEYLGGALAARLFYLRLDDLPGAPESLLAPFVAGVAVPVFFISGINPIAPQGYYNCFVSVGFIVIIYRSARSDLFREHILEPNRGPTNIFRLLSYIGTISYSLYMTHGLLLGALLLSMPWIPAAITIPFHGEIATIGYVVLALATASVVFHFFEQPSYRLIIKGLQSFRR